MALALTCVRTSSSRAWSPSNSQPSGRPWLVTMSCKAASSSSASSGTGCCTAELAPGVGRAPRYTPPGRVKMDASARSNFSRLARWLFQKSSGVGGAGHGWGAVVAAGCAGIVAAAGCAGSAAGSDGGVVGIGSWSGCCADVWRLSSGAAISASGVSSAGAAGAAADDDDAAAGAAELDVAAGTSTSGVVVGRDPPPRGRL